ncbi:TFP11-domain-containing protein [Moesziomyces antarcticus]|uniref:Related to Tuftelin-interacting protein 11 n=2 Tax=Pseudozyma antarctica TaxID=84753 RepID=A0A5C3FML3_PSEA2|nr:TFP11-domain-containing protein [Moesziomyces antarcticus]GAK64640.1 TFP11-domain-containing protein [Moesziomyces antarcticus]SPO45622.1 related to Tuftelin-interacting protein 11 [Moesziomyces antarcticus]
MARRKKDPFSDDDTSTDDDSFDVADVDDEALNGVSGLNSSTRPAHKRPRRTKDDAIYGMFGEGDHNEHNGSAGRTVRARDARGKKIDYRRGQAFIPASASAAAASTQHGESLHTQEAAASGSGGSDSSDSDSNSEAEMLQDAGGAEAGEEDDFQPASFRSSRGGIGSHGNEQAPRPQRPPPTEQPQKRSGRAGIGARAGIGSSSSNRDGDDTASAPRRTGLTSLSMFVSAGASRPSEPAPPGPPPTPPATLASTSDAATSTTAPEPPSSTTTQQPDAIAAVDDQENQMSAAGLPTSFSRPSVAPSSAFQRTRKPDAPAVPRTSIKFGGKFDPSAYLASMGWTGGGLGKAGQGIVNPIEVQLRPERAGIAYGGLKEKTQQAKDEARRRGEAVSSDEETHARRGHGKKRHDKHRRKADGEAAETPRAWTKKEKKPRKPRVEHRTYEQILAEVGAVRAPSTLGKIYDASSGELREVADLASALGSRGAPTAEANELPELQHNLRLICTTNAQTLTALAREGAQIQDRRRWLRREAEQAERQRAADAAKLQRVQQALVLVRELEAVHARAAKLDPDATQDARLAALEAFTPIVARLEAHARGMAELALDEAVVGAAAPLLRAVWTAWRPLKEPQLIVSMLQAWAGMLHPQETAGGKGKRVMTAWEALIWNVWMPPVRSALNAWKPHHPSAAVELLEAWRGVVPQFVYDNLVDQIVLPKLHSALGAWEPKSSWRLDHVVFPWLPVLGTQRLGEVMGEAKRRLRSALKTADIPAGPDGGLEAWRKLYAQSGGEWDALMLATVVPRLSSHLRGFKVDPADQKMDVLEAVFAWTKVVRRSVVARVVAAEVFPQWLGVLGAWITQPGADLDEVAQWYEFWRGYLEPLCTSDPTNPINAGFAIALDWINLALDTPPEQRAQLKPPVYVLPSRRSEVKPAAAGVQVAEVATLRDVLAEELAVHDLFLFKTAQVHRTGPASTATVWRVARAFEATAAAAAKVYIDDDVVFRSDEHGWTPVSIAELVQSLA